MAVYRNVNLNFWTDTKVIDDFSPEDKYFMLYLLTNPHTNLSGCYEISIKQISNEMGYTADSISALISRMENYKIISYSKDTKEMLIKNWYKYNWTNSEKFSKPLSKELEKIKNYEFANYLIEIFNNKYQEQIPYRYGIDTVSDKVRYGIDTTVTDTVTDTVTVNNNTKTNNKKDKSKFIPPTLEEVKAYIAVRDLKVDSNSFYEYFTEGNWTDSKGNKVKNWKQKLLTWSNYDKTPPKNKGKTAIKADYVCKYDEEEVKRALFEN